RRAPSVAGAGAFAGEFLFDRRAIECFVAQFVILNTVDSIIGHSSLSSAMAQSSNAMAQRSEHTKKGRHRWRKGLFDSGVAG
ncbi:MAG: hypothetical protein O3A96_09590, partial [Proteobacteria bacterium]|nr:hypothetical protein [Pseudomonadota bacterium]